MRPMQVVALMVSPRASFYLHALWGNSRIELVRLQYVSHGQIYLKLQERVQRITTHLESAVAN